MEFVAAHADLTVVLAARESRRRVVLRMALRFAKNNHVLAATRLLARYALRGMMDREGFEPSTNGLRVPIGQPRGLLFILFSYRQKLRAWHICQALDFPTEFGRREWTRTIDPHHVKVGKLDFLGCPGTLFFL
jgi:hypothetical protein